MGVNQGGAKGNKQEAEYEEPGEKTRETRSEGTGRAREAKAERAHWGSHCEAEAGRRGKEETESQVAGGGREADERKWNGSGKDRKRKHKVST